MKEIKTKKELTLKQLIRRIHWVTFILNVVLLSILLVLLTVLNNLNIPMDEVFKPGDRFSIIVGTFLGIMWPAANLFLKDWGDKE